MGEGNMLGRSVLIVEDEALLRELLAHTLEARGFIVTTAASAADAKRIFAQIDPDAIVLDVDLGRGPNGFDVAESIRLQAPHVGIVFLTNLPDQRFASVEPEKLPKGIAYLRKSALTNVDLLVDALDAVLRGQGADNYRQDRDDDRPLGALTRKQIQVLQLVALGKTNSQIAQERGVSVKAIEDTIGRLCAALGINSSAEGNVRVAAVRQLLNIRSVPEQYNELP
jgi:DNA-binding NarL/FixJ family response regulator